MYKNTGIILADAQPFHNGHVKVISEALMRCSTVVVVFINYNSTFFDYNYNQKAAKLVFGNNPNIKYTGCIITDDIAPLVECLTNIQVIPTVLISYNEQEKAIANILGIDFIKTGRDPKYKASDIRKSMQNDDDKWMSSIPEILHDHVITYIKTIARKRNYD